ncbi:MAG: Transketolase [Caulobacteraceae bacterium]|nr:Transketolase [Caulobacteraceae bacterium]
MAFDAKLGHPGGDLSAADILACLYGAVLNYDPGDPRWASRDRFVLSKGHASASFYSALAFSGYFPPEELKTFMQPLSRLNGHPDRNKLPGVEANTGPLGHGLPIAVGMALSARLDAADWRVFVLTGDGELQEGSNWEAAMSAAHFKLSHLTVIVDRNRLQQGDWTENTVGLDPLADKWRAFGFEVQEIDGHDPAAIVPALTDVSASGGPRCIIANTTKGRGVSFMQDIAAWHHKIPTAEQLKQAFGELA